MRIVTVDFDGTLYQGNSFKIMFQVGKKKFTLRQWVTVYAGLVKACTFGLFKGKNKFKLLFFKAFAKTFKGKTQAELDDFFQELVDTGKEDINKELVSKIQEHQENGDTIIILSGALQPFLERFIKVLDLNVHIISTELAMDNAGICTGEIGQIVNGSEKVKKVAQFIEKEKSDEQPEIWAYADSESDIPLLNYVTFPIVVNPDEEMKTIAKKNNWPIFAQ